MPDSIWWVIFTLCWIILGYFSIYATTTVGLREEPSQDLGLMQKLFRVLLFPSSYSVWNSRIYEAPSLYVYPNERYDSIDIFLAVSLWPIFKIPPLALGLVMVICFLIFRPIISLIALPARSLVPIRKN